MMKFDCNQRNSNDVRSPTQLGIVPQRPLPINFIDVMSIAKR